MIFTPLQLFIGPFNEDKNEDLMCIPRKEDVPRSLALGDAAGTFLVSIPQVESIRRLPVRVDGTRTFLVLKMKGQKLQQ